MAFLEAEYFCFIDLLNPLMAFHGRAGPPAVGALYLL